MFHKSGIKISFLLFWLYLYKNAVYGKAKIKRKR